MKEVLAIPSFWSLRGNEECHMDGIVGFAMKMTLNILIGLPKGVNDWPLTMTLLLHGRKHVTVSSTYVTITTDPGLKDTFYEELHSIIVSLHRVDNHIIIHGDFNAQVGSDNISWDEVIGKYGVSHYDSSGLQLLKICAKHELLITNTIFYPIHNRALWMHPLNM